MAGRFSRVSKIALILITLAGILLSAFGSSCSPRGYSGKTESITFANLPLESSALIYIAENKQFFSENGLAFTIKDYDTGVTTIGAVLKGEADMGNLTEFVMVGNVLQKRGVSVLGSMDKSMPMYLIGRRDRGISNISDLAGKRIGLREER